MYADDREHLGLALPAVGGAISAIGGLFGGRQTGAAVYREDGARWSAAKQYWELPPGTRAKVQSPKPSGVGIQSLRGGPAESPGAYQQPTASSFGGPVVAGLSTGPLLLTGAAILGIAMLSRGGRRR